LSILDCSFLIVHSWLPILDCPFLIVHSWLQSRNTGNIGHKRLKIKTRKTKHNTTQKTKKMSNTNLTKNRGWTQVLTFGPFVLILSFILHGNHEYSVIYLHHILRAKECNTPTESASLITEVNSRHIFQRTYIKAYNSRIHF
jgi:hypothetical protein